MRSRLSVRIAMRSWLSVRCRLWCLLALPLLVVAAVSVPIVDGGVDDARAARSAATFAARARSTSTFIQDLQVERLLTLTYLVSPTADRDVVRVAAAEANDRQGLLLSQLRSPADDELASAVRDIDRLDSIRAGALARTASPVEFDRAFHQAVVGLTSALGLTTRIRATGNAAGAAAGFWQLQTLETLLRINEDITRVGAALVIGTADVATASQLLPQTLAETERDIAQFWEVADADHAASLAVVVHGQTAQQISEYARQITTSGLWAEPAQVLTVAETTLSLTRVLGARMVRDIAGRTDAMARDAGRDAGLGLGLAVMLWWCVAGAGALVIRSIVRSMRETPTLIDGREGSANHSAEPSVAESVAGLSQRQTAPSGRQVAPSQRPAALPGRQMLELPRYPDPGVVSDLLRVPDVPIIDGTFPWFDENEHEHEEVAPTGQAMLTGRIEYVERPEPASPAVDAMGGRPMLSRRVPGINMSESLRSAASAASAASVAPSLARPDQAYSDQGRSETEPSDSARSSSAGSNSTRSGRLRDPEAERQAIQSLIDGFARAAGASPAASSYATNPDESEQG